MAELYGPALERFIASESAKRNLDPRAVLGVATAEGGFYGAVGDQGTSFGPFQMHAGGDLPPSVWAQGAPYSKAWANSPFGVDRALDNIAQVAAGLKGYPAVQAIVLRYERPADPTHDLTTAGAYVAGHQGAGFLNGLGGLGKGLKKIVTWAPPGFPDITTGKVTGFGDITSVVLKALFILAGVLILIVGLYLVARSLGVSLPAPVAAAAAPLAARVPGTQAARRETASAATRERVTARERRTEETHQERMAASQTRREATVSSIEAKRRTKSEQEAAERSAYWRGAAEGSREAQAAATAARERKVASKPGARRPRARKKRR